MGKEVHGCYMKGNGDSSTLNYENWNNIRGVMGGDFYFLYICLDKYWFKKNKDFLCYVY